MKATMFFIESDGRLYRGLGRCYPALLWQPESRCWTICNLPTPQEDSWCELVTVREAERLYPGSSTAPAPPGLEFSADLSGEEIVKFRPEWFDGYDGRIFRLSPEEEAENDIRIEPLVAEVRAIMETNRRSREAAEVTDRLSPVLDFGLNEEEAAEVARQKPPTVAEIEALIVSEAEVTRRGRWGGAPAPRRKRPGR